MIPIRDNKFRVKNAKVSLHFDSKNNSMHLDLKIPKPSNIMLRHINKKEGKWVLKNKPTNFWEFAIILQNYKK